MLRDVEIRQNFIGSMIAAMNGNSSNVVRLGTGLYQVGHFSLDNCIDRELIVNRFPTFNYEPGSGVCDDPDQFMELYGSILGCEDRWYVVGFTPVYRDSQPPEGGWRWSKWGPYIGRYEPQAEYLYNEPEIERVYCFHITEVSGD